MERYLEQLCPPLPSPLENSIFQQKVRKENAAFSFQLILNKVEMASALNMKYAPKDILNKVKG